MDDELPSAGQIKAARALLGWSQERLSAASGKARRTIAKFELEEGATNPETVIALKKSLEAAGIVFRQGDGLEGVDRRS